MATTDQDLSGISDLLSKSQTSLQTQLKKLPSVNKEFLLKGGGIGGRSQVQQILGEQKKIQTQLKKVKERKTQVRDYRQQLEQQQQYLNSPEYEKAKAYSVALNYINKKTTPWYNDPQSVKDAFKELRKKTDKYAGFIKDTINLRRKEISDIQASLPSGERLVLDSSGLNITGIESSAFNQSLSPEAYNIKISQFQTPTTSDTIRQDLISAPTISNLQQSQYNFQTLAPTIQPQISSYSSIQPAQDFTIPQQIKNIVGQKFRDIKGTFSRGVGRIGSSYSGLQKGVSQNIPTIEDIGTYGSSLFYKSRNNQPLTQFERKYLEQFEKTIRPAGQLGAGIYRGIQENPLTVGASFLAGAGTGLAFEGLGAGATSLGLTESFPITSKVISGGVRYGLPAIYGLDVAQRVGAEEQKPKTEKFGEIFSSEILPFGLGAGAVSRNIGKLSEADLIKLENIKPTYEAGVYKTQDGGIKLLVASTKSSGKLQQKGLTSLDVIDLGEGQYQIQSGKTLLEISKGGKKIYSEPSSFSGEAQAGKGNIVSLTQTEEGLQLINPLKEEIGTFGKVQVTGRTSFEPTKKDVKKLSSTNAEKLINELGKLKVEPSVTETGFFAGAGIEGKGGTFSYIGTSPKTFFGKRLEPFTISEDRINLPIQQVLKENPFFNPLSVRTSYSLSEPSYILEGGKVRIPRGQIENIGIVRKFGKQTPKTISEIGEDVFKTRFNLKEGTLTQEQIGREALNDALSSGLGASASAIRTAETFITPTAEFNPFFSGAFITGRGIGEKLPDKFLLTNTRSPLVSPSPVQDLINIPIKKNIFTTTKQTVIKKIPNDFFKPSYKPSQEKIINIVGIEERQGFTQPLLQFEIVKPSKQSKQQGEFFRTERKQKQSQNQFFRTEQDKRLKQKKAQERAQIPKQRESSRTKLLPKPQQRGVLIPRQISKLRFKTPQIKIRVPLIPIIPKGGSQKTTPTSRTPKPKNFFVVYGKRQGKDIPLFKTRTKKEAEGLFVNYQKSTLSRSGFIFSGAKGRKLSFGELSLGQEFRPSKRDPFRLVQKAKFSLGTSSERKQIQQARKQSPKKTKKKTKTNTRRNLFFR